MLTRHALAILLTTLTLGTASLSAAAPKGPNAGKQRAAARVMKQVREAAARLAAYAQGKTVTATLSLQRIIDQGEAFTKALKTTLDEWKADAKRDAANAKEKAAEEKFRAKQKRLQAESDREQQRQQKASTKKPKRKPKAQAE